MRLVFCMALLAFAPEALAQEAPAEKRAYFVTAGASRLMDFRDATVNGFNFGAGMDLFASPYLRGAVRLDTHMFRESGFTVHNMVAVGSLRALLGSGFARPYGEVAFGLTTSSGSEVPFGTEMSAGLEWTAGGKTAFLGYTATSAEEPMQSLRLGMRIP
jgi:hypothetical protein